MDSEAIVRAALSVGVSSPEIRGAIVDLIRAQIPAPKEEWREVFVQVSALGRYRQSEAGKKYGVAPVKFYLWQKAYYNDVGRVGKVVAFQSTKDAIISEYDDKDLDSFYRPPEIANEVFPAKHYTEVIRAAMSLWPAMLAKFEHMVRVEE